MSLIILWDNIRTLFKSLRGLGFKFTHEILDLHAKVTRGTINERVWQSNRNNEKAGVRNAM